MPSGGQLQLQGPLAWPDQRGGGLPAGLQLRSPGRPARRAVHAAVHDPARCRFAGRSRAADQHGHRARPLGEELAFRHFLLNLFPFRKPLWAVVAIVVSALAFAAIHLQYTFRSTVVLLFILALMLAYARIRTGGLLVPMAMHACASTLALAMYPLFYP
ncbi:CPBP family intramembrane metalloprotease [Pseudomonas qingdaonensis]|nr:CPBP family intramembrane metalloprotease [Pseudomonas qingdaonensis]